MQLTELRLDGGCFNKCNRCGAESGANMMEIIIGIAGGMLLGLRWKCTVLYVTIPIVVVAMTAIGGVSFSNMGQILLDITAIQVGYVFGVVARPMEVHLGQSLGGSLHRR